MKMVSSISTVGVWSCPATTGDRPPPCTDLTFTAVDDRRAVLFGGYNGEQGRMNDVYIIDLSTMVLVCVCVCVCAGVLCVHYEQYWNISSNPPQAMCSFKHDQCLVESQRPLIHSNLTSPFYMSICLS